jgi:hypothetical protein
MMRPGPPAVGRYQLKDALRTKKGV